MNSYTVYIAAAYVVTGLVVVGNVVAARRQFRRVRERLQKRIARQAGRGTAAAAERNT